MVEQGEMVHGDFRLASVVALRCIKPVGPVQDYRQGCIKLFSHIDSIIEGRLHDFLRPWWRQSDTIPCPTRQMGRTLTGSPVTVSPKVNPMSACVSKDDVQSRDYIVRTTAEREERHSQAAGAQTPEQHVLWLEFAVHGMFRCVFVGQLCR